MLKRIHINQHNIRFNNSKEPNVEPKPVITCKTYKGNQKSNTLRILSESGQEVARVVYQPNKPLSCGAKVWIETNATVELA